MEALTYARVHEHLGKLKLDRVAAVLDRVAEDAANRVLKKRIDCERRSS